MYAFHVDKEWAYLVAHEPFLDLYQLLVRIAKWAKIGIVTLEIIRYASLLLTRPAS